MNKKLDLIILVGSLALVLLIALGAYQYLTKDNTPNNLATLAPVATDGTGDTAGTGETEGTSPQAQLAPDFTVYDLDGNAHKLSDYRGKPVVLNFWASWCDPCKSEMPDFEKIYTQYGQDIHFLMVNLTDGLEETVASASGFIAEKGYTFPVYYDTDMDAAQAYGVYSVPVTYFIDAEGYLIAYGSGALTADILQQGIDMIQ